MQVINVELYTNQQNGAVLKLPGRQFPGILIQGDTLQSYVTDLTESLSECRRLTESGNVCEGLEDLLERLTNLQERYNTAIVELKEVGTH